MTLRSSWAEDTRLPGDQVAPMLRSLVADPSSIDDRQWAVLLGAQGAELDELCALADSARRDVVGDELTFVANRNLETGAVIGSGSSASVEDLVAEAWELGATEICLQGPVPQSESADAYLGLVRRISATAPDMHLHAYRVPEVRDAANRLALTPREFLEAARDAGVGTVPGTAAQVLDDEVRGVLTPDGLSVAEWVETITTAHGIGLRSTATMLYGHVETPAQQIAHLRLLVDIQRRTGGFTELILMPMLPENAPPHLRAQAVRGPSLDETRALHAVARLLTLGAIDHLQAAWTKLDEVALDAVLRGGADDVGGVLIDGRLRPDAGPESGRQLVPAQVAEIAGALGRTTRQRTTLYETAPDDRQAVLQKVFA